MNNTKLRSVTAVLSKVIEVVLWVSAAMILFASVVLTVSRSAITEAAESGALEVAATNEGVRNTQTIEWFLEAMKAGTAGLVLVPFVFLIALTALIFRNLYLILRKTNTDSPFSELNVKRIRNIGILAIALPIARAVLAFIYTVALGYQEEFFAVSASDIVLGLVALCISQYFAYGAKLEQDVDGLL